MNSQYLTKEEEAQIIKICQDPNRPQQEKTDAFEKLFFLNKGIITNEIDKNIKRYNLRHETFEDLMQDCCVEMFRAIENFDLKHDIKFMTYASHSIRRVVMRYKENYTRAYALPKNFFSEIVSIQNGTPSKAVSEARKRDMLDVFAKTDISIDKEIFTDSGEKFGNTIPQQQTKVIDEVLVHELLQKLSKREREILMNFYGFSKEKNFAETARIFGLSRERIRQLHNLACTKLKRMLEEKGIFSSEEIIDFV